MGSHNLPATTEREFQEQIVRLATLRGWWVHHHYDSRRSSAGWPDLVLIRPPRLIYAELKTDRGKTTPAQEAVLELLRKSGQRAHVWRPKDWNLIQKVLH